MDGSQVDRFKDLIRILLHIQSKNTDYKFIFKFDRRSMIESLVSRNAQRKTQLKDRKIFWLNNE